MVSNIYISKGKRVVYNPNRQFHGFLKSMHVLCVPNCDFESLTTNHWVRTT